MAVVAVAGHTTRLTSRLAGTAASEKTLGPLEVTRDFGSPRPWDPWFGGLQGRAKLHFMVVAAGIGSWAVGSAVGRGICGSAPASDKVCQALKSSHFFLDWITLGLPRMMWVVLLLKPQQCLV